jgi:hypothetical protein
MSQYTINLAADQRVRQETAGRFFMIVAITGAVGSIDLKFDVRGQGDRNDEHITTAAPGFKLKLDRSRFDSVDFLAAGTCTVSYVISDNEVDFDFSEGSNVIATLVGPVPPIIIDDTVPVRVELDTPLPLPVTVIGPDPLPVLIDDSVPVKVEIDSPLPLPVELDIGDDPGNPIYVVNDRGTPGNLLHVTGVSLSDAPAVSVTNNAAVACSDVAAVVIAADTDRREIRFLNLGPDPVAIGAAGITWAARTIVLEQGDIWIEDRGANLAWSGITDTGDAADVTVQEVLA